MHQTPDVARQRQAFLDTYREAIVTAACRWAGAAAVIEEYRNDPRITSEELAGHEQWLRSKYGAPLIKAVDTYVDLAEQSR